MEVNKCSGCSLCKKICPVNAVNISKNYDGFYEATINLNKCVNCGACKKICPNLNFLSSNKTIDAYSYVNENAEKLKESSSGGISRKLIDSLRNEYIVSGVKYDYKTNSAVHIICINDEDLDSLYGSKYIQSDFYTCIDKMDFNKKNLVFGTPCQISALHNYLTLKNKRENFILVDFFCHGVPSYLLWHNYLKENNIAKPNYVKFRSKKFGWHNFTLHIKNSHMEKIGSLNNNDLFYKIFLSNTCLNNSCYTCKYRCNNSNADIRIGDMWGKKYCNNMDGVSAILTFTEKGKNVIENIDGIKRENYNDVVEEQIKTDMSIPSCRKKVINDLAKHKRLRYIYYADIIPYKILKRMGIKK